MALDFEAELEMCRRRFGARPRSFGWWERVSYLNTARPVWCGGGDQLSTYFKNQAELLRAGQIVWSCVIQANSLLFSPGPANCPGDVVYALPPDENVDPQYLANIAQQIGQLKGEHTGFPGMDRIGDHLADEHTRVFGLPVPQAISPMVSCAISTVLFNRKHLPGGVLSVPFFPLLVSPRDPSVAMVLPSNYWGPSLKALW